MSKQLGHKNILYLETVFNKFTCNGNPTILRASQIVRDVNGLVFNRRQEGIVCDLIDIEEFGKKRLNQSADENFLNNYVYLFKDNKLLENFRGEKLEYRKKTILGLLQYCPVLPSLLQLTFVYKPKIYGGKLNYVNDDRIIGETLMLAYTVRRHMEIL